IHEPSSPENVMTVRDRPLDRPRQIERGKWRFIDDSTVTIDGGFEPGRIYDVVYRGVAPRVLGCGLAGTRDLLSFLRYTKGEPNPLRGVKFVYGWGASQSGRFLRHFLYEGFNEDEDGRRVLDGIIDEVGGAGRGSFNHRFGQASRDAEQFLNIFYPVDMFPFTDGPVTDTVTGRTDGLLARAQARNVAPKIFHVLSNSEYFNRAGSLIHTDPEGQRDVAPPANARIYLVSSTPHYFGAFPPVPPEIMAAPMNPLNRRPVSRALLAALDAWVAEGTPPPPSRYPRISDGTLTPPERAGWPKIPGVSLPLPMLITYRLDFGPDWSRGIVSFEPPRVGKPFGGLVPAVDRDGLDRAGIRLPAIQIPVATYAGWNFRSPSAGSTDQFSGEAGSFHPFARTAAERVPGDSRLSIAERYTNREEYLFKVNAVARQVVKDRLLMTADVPDVIAETMSYYGWAVGKDRR
ncbi:MAG: alpha/beta hydrolase domain-containing protein, partial [Bryobacteraceae bacterium]